MIPTLHHHQHHYATVGYWSGLTNSWFTPSFPISCAGWCHYKCKVNPWVPMGLWYLCLAMNPSCKIPLGKEVRTPAVRIWQVGFLGHFTPEFFCVVPSLSIKLPGGGAWHRQVHHWKSLAEYINVTIQVFTYQQPWRGIGERAANRVRDVGGHAKKITWCRSFTYYPEYDFFSVISLVYYPKGITAVNLVEIWDVYVIRVIKWICLLLCVVCKSRRHYL